ncbi:MAG: hypothetical protein NVS1B11_05510 [Terriglobales bacterium]
MVEAGAEIAVATVAEIAEAAVDTAVVVDEAATSKSLTFTLGTYVCE